jgi:DNA-binding LacI/PurR family transcriptional regulator
MIDGIENYVILDDEYAGREATEHLIKLGHKNIGHITGPSDTGTGKARLSGFENAMKHHNLNVPQENIEESSYSIEDGYYAMKKLLDLKEPPTAVFAGSILIALGAMRAINEANYTIPKDFSLISIHDVPFAPALHPSLTTVKMPLHQMGKEAVRNLISVIKGETKKCQFNDKGRRID